ncbi:MAG TPA: hypothetical protein VKI19_00610 [Acidimicrobiales bacterium]|nr:hypothetical protein [Acidimicrobiales bacterium]
MGTELVCTASHRDVLAWAKALPSMVLRQALGDSASKRDTSGPA